MSRSQALYDLILSKAKPKWFSGEVLHLWEEDKLSVSLWEKSDWMEVNLHISGWRNKMRVFFTEGERWEVSRDFTPFGLDDFISQYNMMAKRFKLYPIRPDGLGVGEKAASTTPKGVAWGVHFKLVNGSVQMTDGLGNIIDSAGN